MNLQEIVDRTMIYLTSPTGWIAVVVVIGIALFMMKGNSPR
jgi:hypothetical protein